MKQDLENYICTYKNVVSEEISKKCLEEFKTLRFRENSFVNPSTNEEKTYENEPWVIDEYINPDLNDLIWNLVKEYIQCLDFPWFDGWNGFTYPRINKYKNNQKMKPHCDRIKSMFEGPRKGDPTLTVLGVFDCEYEGGALKMFGKKEIDFGPRDIVIFPSAFMYPHEITPVTSGERISFVSWVW